MKKFTFNLILIFFFASISHSHTLQWIEQVSGTTQTLTSVSSNFFNTVWVCGYGGTVLRSTNLGVAWTNVSGNGIPATTQLISISAGHGSSNVALAAGYVGSNTFVYRTSNGGANWTQVFTQTGGFINSVNMKFETIGFMMGDPVGGRWSLWKTSNGGVNWDSTGLYLPQSGTEAGWVNSLFCINDKIWFGTNNTRVYYSSNYGSTWQVQPTTGEINSYSVWYCRISFGDYNGFLGGSTLQKTSNAGTNWISQTSAGAGNFGGISGGPNLVFDNSVGYLFWFYVRSDNKIYWSEAGNPVWSVDYTAPAGIYRFIGSDEIGMHIWAVRDNGGISYLDLPVGVESSGNQIPNKFSLEQNFPNPFNPSTVIKYSVPEFSKVELTIYDIRGKEINKLVSALQAAGEYSVEWDGKDSYGMNVNSGVYFYKMISGNGFSETKRMMLIK